MLCFDVGLAKEIGLNRAIVVNQIHYWTSKGFGKSIDGRVYIYNTYEQWLEQFPFWSYNTIRRTFEKLVDTEVLYAHRKGYNRTSFWSLNYSHPIISNWANPSAQIGQMDLLKLGRSVHTLTQRKQQKPTASKSTPSTKRTTKTATDKTKTYREEFTSANDWLKTQTKDFQKETTEYIDYHRSSPKTHYPHALGMKILVEIWRKYTDQIHHTDFDYIDKSELKASTMPVIQVLPKKKMNGLDDEMNELYLRGEA